MRFKRRNLRAIAEMVIGDEEYFPYRSSSYITQFFEECDLGFVHDGSTRWAWTADRLEELLHQRLRRAGGHLTMGCGCEQVKHVVQGAAKLVQSAAGVGLADEATIEQRRALCRACEHAMPCKTNSKRYCKCARCGCWLKHKTRLAGERCPVGKW